VVARWLPEGAGGPRISVIVPVLNEGESIGATLRSLQAWRSKGAEIIVVDGGSSDDTVAQARDVCDRVLDSPRGRARQMNAGAAVARGRLLIFLHADTQLPDDAFAMLDALADAPRLWGRFDVRIDGAHPFLPVIAAAMNRRSRWSGVATGDQAMFVSRELFSLIGGFPDIALMEDVALSKRLRRLCPPRCLRAQVLTSGRRWLRGGVLRTVLLMWGLRLAYVLGVPPATLARWYRHAR